MFHARHEQIRQLQRDLHSALQGHAKRGRLRDDEHDDDDPLAGVHLTKRELEVHNRLLNDEGGSGSRTGLRRFRGHS